MRFTRWMSIPEDALLVGSQPETLDVAGPITGETEDARGTILQRLQPVIFPPGFEWTAASSFLVRR